MTDDGEAVLRDLIDAVIQEDLVAVRPGPPPPGAAEAGPGQTWCRLGGVRARLRAGGALQAWRLAGGPLLDADGEVVGADRVVAALGLAGPASAQLTEDLGTAVAHARALAVAHRRRLSGGLFLTGERLALTRGRPFHPTGRAATGWTAEEVTGLGALRAEPLGLSWVAVRRDRLRHGPAPGSTALPGLLLDGDELDTLHAAAATAGVTEDAHELLPVHPWQARHVLPGPFAAELADRSCVAVADGLGRFHPTASWRTLVVADAPERHVKLPLGIATLGATRLLPPRHLDNGDRAERTMRAVVETDPVLRDLVAVAAEGTWAGWSEPEDEFADRPGHLAAQVRTYPPGALDGPALPMAALAAHAWELLGPALGVTDPVACFGGLADAFTAMGLAFLNHGVLPELHGQNVVVRCAPGGSVTGFVLRDHDTLRLHAPWMRAAGVADPAYRIAPGVRQSLRLDTAGDLVGYLQTLGFQVNLYGIADALARHHGLDEHVLWARLRTAVEHALDTVALRADVAAVVTDALLTAPRWPSRTLVGPLLAAGRSRGVSMPAGTGTVPNPFRGGALIAAESASRQRLLNAFLREVAPTLTRSPDSVRVELAASGSAVVVGLRRWSPSGHHVWAGEVAVDVGDGPRPAAHDEVVARLLDELAARAPGRGHRDELARRIADSEARTARSLAAPARADPESAHDRTRHAEQSLRFGHPFHPTPKSAEGFDDADTASFAPELGASFHLHHLAIALELVAERRVLDAPWTPPAVTERAPAGWPTVPVHPFQDRVLRRDPTVRRLIAEGGLVPLGPLGGPVYATSSVRTVCDPAFPTSWKLPLHVRITNFVRTNPVEHVRRAADAGALVGRLRPGWAVHDGFAVLAESGWRGVDPGVVGDDLAADLTVLYRDNPFADTDARAPRVLAGLIEPGPRGEEPVLVTEIREAGVDVGEWLRAYLRLSLLPLLAVFGADGVGFEAHPQNSLLHTEGGRPAAFWVRDMEGAHVSRERRPSGLDEDSPLLYDEDEAWRRLRYHLVVNQVAMLVATLGRGAGEEHALWRVVAATLADLPGSCAAAEPYAADLLSTRTLPAKANLTSLFAGHAETPSFVEVANPIHGALA